MRRILLVALLLAACHPPPEEKPPVGLTEIPVPALGVAVSVPEGTEVEYVGGGATFYTRPNARNGRVFAIEEWPSAPIHREPASPAVHRALAAGVTVEYLVQELDGGSGGEEAALSGALTIGEATFAIHCHDQAEAPARPKPEWCLDYLATTRLTGR